MNDRDIIKKMNQYYAGNAPEHDRLMGYSSNVEMEKLLAPIISIFEDMIKDKDVLEIACGTGNWTQVLAKRAHSVHATDINRAAIEIARSKTEQYVNVSFQEVDAYALGEAEGDFSAVFAADWWSHIPKSSINAFLKGLHNRLAPRAKAIFIDMMPSDGLARMFSHYDEDGNIIHKRTLPDGRNFYVVKNHPTEAELRGYLSGLADNIQYYEDHRLLRWTLIYDIC